jgi:hypothetical protein
VQPGFGEDSPYGPGQPPYPPGPPQQADYGGPLPDYLKPGFTPRDSAPPRNSTLAWIIGAVVAILIVAAVAVVLAV